MKARFGSVWQPLGAFQTPTLVKRVPDAFLLASSRRGGLGGRVSANPTSTMLRRVRGEEEEEERVEQEASDTSIDSSAAIWKLSRDFNVSCSSGE